MPAAATPVSVGLDPVSKVAGSAVLKWVGEKIAGGIIGAAAGKGFNAAIDAIFGSGDNSAELAEKLDAISKQITEVQRSLDRLTAMAAEILQQIDRLRDFMEKSVKADTLLKARLTIDTIYGSVGDASLYSAVAGRPISLRLLLEQMPHFKGMTPKKLQDAAKDFVSYAAEVLKAINTIRDELVDDGMGMQSLLQLWAKELGQQVRDKKIGREDAGLVLESYFLQAVSTQLKGVCVHCTALSVDAEDGEEFVRIFLRTDFGVTMEKQAAAYVQAMEYLIFSSLDPVALTGRKTTMDEREFPYHVDDMLLRADLTAAALSLVRYTGDADGKPAPSRQAAIQGIYGRALMRPSDIVADGTPSIALPGFGAAAGSKPHKLPYAVLDLVVEDGKPVLCDVGTTFVHQSRYKWSFASSPPAVGTVIDSNQRLGVTVKEVSVFGADEPMVLAASVFDASRITRGLPAGVKTDTFFVPFPGGYPHAGFKDQSCDARRHPLTNGTGILLETRYNFVSAERADMSTRMTAEQRLFQYKGAKVRARLWVHMKGRMQAGARKDTSRGTELGHQQDLPSHIMLRLPDRSLVGLGNTIDKWALNVHGDHDRALSLMYAMTKPGDYDQSSNASLSVDFDLVPGDYQLVLYNDCWITQRNTPYDGWNSATQTLTFEDVTLEMVF
ncbi:hypothetical protein [Ramlibacter sp. WS9]|uniref:hypothetical protein n=1 Tax=Ramlibacter sp. WS9 TaxID=1882741 RepID=UPI001141A59D|nr:hypothetical protein [Ramlibacter sp. WS9]ROZ64183.1 hypothetical protein EEB15_28915 [Ramlibacter sp. WS9]